MTIFYSSITSPNTGSPHQYQHALPRRHHQPLPTTAKPPERVPLPLRPFCPRSFPHVANRQTDGTHLRNIRSEPTNRTAVSEQPAFNQSMRVLKLAYMPIVDPPARCAACVSQPVAPRFSHPGHGCCCIRCVRRESVPWCYAHPSQTTWLTDLSHYPLVQPRAWMPLLTSYIPSPLYPTERNNLGRSIDARTAISLILHHEQKSYYLLFLPSTPHTTACHWPAWTLIYNARIAVGLSVHRSLMQSGTPSTIPRSNTSGRRIVVFVQQPPFYSLHTTKRNEVQRRPAIFDKTETQTRNTFFQRIIISDTCITTDLRADPRHQTGRHILDHPDKAALHTAHPHGCASVTHPRAARSRQWACSAPCPPSVSAWMPPPYGPVCRCRPRRRAFARDRAPLPARRPLARRWWTAPPATASAPCDDAPRAR